MTGLLGTLPAVDRGGRSAAIGTGGRDLVSDPMLATLGGRRDSSDQWIFERKPDVIRVLAVRDGDSVTLVAPYAPPPVPSPPSYRASEHKDLSRTGTFGRSLGVPPS